MADSFTFELVSPERLLLSEDALEVTVPGTEGYFGVFANHAPVMSTLRPGLVEAKLANGEEAKFFVRGGFADVSPKGFTLLAEYAVPASEIDAAAIDQQIKNAQEDVADADDDAKRQKAEERLNQLQEVREAVLAA
ncbi:MAG: F0F1 ATP synthase subunit epsilon [Pseudomonadota bacterium]